jgi:bifunctional non-homologous end joining protein LigD
LFAPTASSAPASHLSLTSRRRSPDWVHEVKHDGYRLIVRWDGETVRLFTRRGYDWTGRYPAIASAAAKIRAQSFTLDGEAVVCCEDGVAIFDACIATAQCARPSSRPSIC